MHGVVAAGVSHAGTGARTESTVSRTMPVQRLRIIGATLERMASAWSISSCEYHARKNSPYGSRQRPLLLKKTVSQWRSL